MIVKNVLLTWKLSSFSLCPWEIHKPFQISNLGPYPFTTYLPHPSNPTQAGIASLRILRLWFSFLLSLCPPPGPCPATKHINMLFTESDNETLTHTAHHASSPGPSAISTCFLLSLSFHCGSIPCPGSIKRVFFTLPELKSINFGQ